jgi:DNA repair protein RecN (Recombination protein N)
MLVNLSIRNYAIIKELNVEFASGFCVVTGETGAGKSIIMGALSLILGQRVDTSVLKNKEDKCVVEGRFLLSGQSDLELFFEENDLDFEETIILRREITSLGKSRAFINDTPVQLPLMREIGLKLIDIHSQHSNLELGKRQFQLNVIDWYGGNNELLDNFLILFKELKKIENSFHELSSKSQQANADLDYFEFQFNQLTEARLTDGEQDLLEQEQEMLIHAEEIKSGLNQVHQLLDRDDQSAIVNLKEAVSVMRRMASYLPNAEKLFERLESQLIEMRDIADECELLAEKTEHNPSKLEEITNRLDSIYSLQQKHRVGSIAELIEIRDEFDFKLQTAASYDDELEKLKENLKIVNLKVAEAAEKLHLKRKSLVPQIEKEVTFYLQQLGMPNGQFTIEMKRKDDFSVSGYDEVYFLFTANKGGQLEEINKVASGGELSRLMLAIKTVVARSKALPAIIFDEIDSGISGEIAIKMGEILKSMSQYMQVINITHLPQIASKGDNHYHVFKNETSDGAETGMRQLTPDERIIEISKMLSGEIPSLAAVANAKSLLGL